MRILAIETSCDETAIAVLEGFGDEHGASFRVLGNTLLSQIDLHKEFGGVFPALAKREHAKNIVPILEAALSEAGLVHEDTQTLPSEVRDQIAKMLEREPGLEEQFFDFVTEIEPPEIDAIAVTAGPGLEPALWVGVNFAVALSLVWQKPIVSVNHMEGHVIAALAKHLDDRIAISEVTLPILALLVSGGHTELVLMKEWLAYERIGQTRDDAVGEAFDKVARQLGLPYPGGPEISRLAAASRERSSENPYHFPRPMLDQDNFDFSFSGLKTEMRKHTGGNLSEEQKEDVARGFEDAVVEVLLKKTLRALDETGAHSLAIGGGVSANTHLRTSFVEALRERSDTELHIPSPQLATDNAVMIALSGYFRALRRDFADPETLRADGNLALAN